MGKLFFFTPTQKYLKREGTENMKTSMKNILFAAILFSATLGLGMQSSSVDFGGYYPSLIKHFKTTNTSILELPIKSSRLAHHAGVLIISYAPQELKLSFNAHDEDGNDIEASIIIDNLGNKKNHTKHLKQLEANSIRRVNITATEDTIANTLHQANLGY